MTRLYLRRGSSCGPMGGAGRHLAPGAAAVPVREGVFVAEPETGRLGEVLGDPDGSNEVRLLYLDDDSQSQWGDAATLHPAVRSPADLVLDYSHMQQLGRSLAKVERLDLSGVISNQSW